MFDGRFRAPIEKAVKPVGDSLRKTRLTPDHLTLVGLLFAVVAAVTIALGNLALGLLFVVLAALPDMLDGALAKASGSASQRGAYFDSVADRVTDMLLFGAVAWYFISDGRGLVAMLPIGVMACSSLISYQRAKAESLGLDAKGGLMERAERIILLCLGLLLPVLLVPILCIMLALTAFTAVQRFAKVWNQADPAPVVLERQAERRQRRTARRSARTRRWAELRRSQSSWQRDDATGHRMLRTKDEGIEHVGLTGYKAASLAARYVPEPLLTGVGSMMGFASAQAMRQRRAIVARNLQRIDPSLKGVRLERAIRATFDSYARYWIESFRVPHLSREEVDNGFAMRGYGQIPLALEQGKGAILALPHLGGWEWAGRWLVDRGHRMMAVVEPIEPPELFDFFVSFRESLGMRIVGLGPGAGGQVVRALQDNEVVCLVCDRDILGGGIEVDFFGETTTVPAGPVTIALRTGAPVFPTAVYFTDQRNGHLAHVRPPLVMDRRGPRLRDDIERLTQDLTTELEGLIRAAPDQWHMMQPNWPSDADLAE